MDKRNKMNKINEGKIVKRRSLKYDKSKIKKDIKISYEIQEKFSIPLKNKRKNKYDPIEEARYDDENNDYLFFIYTNCYYLIFVDWRK